MWAGYAWRKQSSLVTEEDPIGNIPLEMSRLRWGDCVNDIKIISREIGRNLQSIRTNCKNLYLGIWS